MPDLHTTEALIAAASAATGGGLARFWSVRSHNTKFYSDSSLALSQAYGLLIDQLQKQITALQEENKELRIDLATIKAELSALRKAAAA